jgi:hypothetical protein
VPVLFMLEGAVAKAGHACNCLDALRA